ncbi:MAG: SGNH/GDSL hydrolase family protein [Actinomycetota bacterium]|nr:SGNH/GDSL hydrolase family protein [Actinomycetota bacterium]
MTRRSGSKLLLVVVAVGLMLLGGRLDHGHSRASTAPGMYVIGDSWTTGYGADPSRTWAQDAARELGLHLETDAAGGTGYLNGAGVDGGTYVQRALAMPAGAHPDLIVLQGGSNDVTENLAGLRQAVEATVAAIRARSGATRIVILGPGLDVQPEPSTYRTVDAALAAVARSDHIPYISMLQEGWITDSNFQEIIDPATGHPSVRGHAYLASRFTKDVAGTTLWPHPPAR